MRKLFLGSLLCFPALASSVTYSILGTSVDPAAPTGTGVVLTAPSFLIVPALQAYYFETQTSSYFNCGSRPIGFPTCDVASIRKVGQDLYVAFTVYNGSTFYTSAEGTFIGADFSSTGTWMSNPGGYLRLTISVGDNPVTTVTPEPSTVLLAIVGLIGVKGSRRLFYRTPNQ